MVEEIRKRLEMEARRRKKTVLLTSQVRWAASLYNDRLERGEERLVLANTADVGATASTLESIESGSRGTLRQLREILRNDR